MPKVDSGEDKHTAVRIAASLAFIVVVAIRSQRPTWFNLDTPALIILGFALLPWVAPLLKTIELSGIGKIELKEVKERVDSLSEKLDALQGLTIRGGSEREQAALKGSLEFFHLYLTELGFKPLPTLPAIVVDSTLVASKQALSLYDPDANEIRIDTRFAGDTDWILRDYVTALLFKNNSSNDGELSFIRSGLADYFVCSHKQEPRFGRRTLESLGTIEVGDAERAMYFRDLASELPAESSVSLVESAARWGQFFWRLRSALGSVCVDTGLEAAWRQFAKRHRNMSSTDATAWLDAVANGCGYPPTEVRKLAKPLSLAQKERTKVEAES